MDARSQTVGAGLAVGDLLVAADGRQLCSIGPVLDSLENRRRTALTVLGPCGRSSL